MIENALVKQAVSGAAVLVLLSWARVDGREIFVNEQFALRVFETEEARRDLGHNIFIFVHMLETDNLHPGMVSGTSLLEYTNANSVPWSRRNRPRLGCRYEEDRRRWYGLGSASTEGECVMNKWGIMTLTAASSFPRRKILSMTPIAAPRE